MESLGADGPTCMKYCMENIAELKRVPQEVDAIHAHTLRLFEELKTAAMALCRQDEEESNVL